MMSMHHKNMKERKRYSPIAPDDVGGATSLCDRGFGDKDLEEGKGSVTNRSNQQTPYENGQAHMQPRTSCTKETDTSPKTTNKQHSHAKTRSRDWSDRSEALPALLERQERSAPSAPRVSMRE